MPHIVEFLSAILIYSENAVRLANFYRDVLGVPLQEEKHGQAPLHYGCELGDVHFAIHPASEQPPLQRQGARRLFTEGETVKFYSSRKETRD